MGESKANEFQRVINRVMIAPWIVSAQSFAGQRKGEPPPACEVEDAHLIPVVSRSVAAGADAHAPIANAGEETVARAVAPDPHRHRDRCAFHELCVEDVVAAAIEGVSPLHRVEACRPPGFRVSPRRLPIAEHPREARAGIGHHHRLFAVFVVFIDLSIAAAPEVDHLVEIFIHVACSGHGQPLLLGKLGGEGRRHKLEIHLQRRHVVFQPGVEGEEAFGAAVGRRFPLPSDFADAVALLVAEPRVQRTWRRLGVVVANVEADDNLRAGALQPTGHRELHTAGVIPAGHGHHHLVEAHPPRGTFRLAVLVDVCINHPQEGVIPRGLGRLGGDLSPLGEIEPNVRPEVLRQVARIAAIIQKRMPEMQPQHVCRAIALHPEAHRARLPAANIKPQLDLPAFVQIVLDRQASPAKFRVFSAHRNRSRATCVCGHIGREILQKILAGASAGSHCSGNQHRRE